MEFTDAVALGGTRTTRDGYLICEAKVARTGIQIYHGADMGRDDLSVVRLYRPEEEVFARDAMASLAHRPVTVDHPKHFVTAETWKDVAVGMTGDQVMRDGEYIRLPFSLMDAAAIADVEAGKRQLSMGYTAVIDWTPGNAPNGEPYDAVQREINGNHLAVVDVARAGPQCRIGDSFSALPPPAGKDTVTMAEPNLRTVVVDGLTISTTDQGAQAIDKLQRQIADMTTAASRRDAEITAMRDAHTAAMNGATAAKDGEIAGMRANHQSAIEAKDGEIAGLKATHQAALEAKDGEIAGLRAQQPTADQMDALIAARALVIDSARKILGDKFDPKGKSDAEIRRSAVEKRLGAAAVADKSDDYVMAAFDTLTAVGVASTGRDPIRDHYASGAAFAASTFNRPRTTVTPQDADDAHDRYVDRLENAWRADFKETV